MKMLKYTFVLFVTAGWVCITLDTWHFMQAAPVVSRYAAVFCCTVKTIEMLDFIKDEIREFLTLCKEKLK